MTSRELVASADTTLKAELADIVFEQVDEFLP